MDFVLYESIIKTFVDITTLISIGQIEFESSLEKYWFTPSIYFLLLKLPFITFLLASDFESIFDVFFMKCF